MRRNVCVGDTHLSQRFETFGYRKDKLTEYIGNFRKNFPEFRDRLVEIYNELDQREVYYFNRFYSNSFHIYFVQDIIVECADIFRKIIPELGLNAFYMQILSEGTGKNFVPSHNQRWTYETRPIVEAMMHTKAILRTLLGIDIEKIKDPQLIHLLYPLYPIS